MVLRRPLHNLLSRAIENVRRYINLGEIHGCQVPTTSRHIPAKHLWGAIRLIEYDAENVDENSSTIVVRTLT